MSADPVTVPAAREDARLRKFDLRRLRVAIGAEVISVIVPDAAGYLRAGGWVDDAERQREPPYWVELWPASIAVSRLLARRGALDGLAVLDLGCGLGLPGICAASLGANVTLADRNPDALAFAEWNATRRRVRSGSVRSRLLDWSADVAPDEPLHDLILLADVTYRPVHHAGVFRQLDASLADDGVVVHAEPWRAESNGFVRQLEQRFVTDQASWRVQGKKGPVDVRIVVAARREASMAPWRQLLPQKSAEARR